MSDHPERADHPSVATAALREQRIVSLCELFGIIAEAVANGCRIPDAEVFIEHWWLILEASA